MSDELNNITPIEPIEPDKFKPLETNISIEPVKKNQLPQPKGVKIDFSQGNVFDKSYQRTQEDTETLGESINQANILLEEIKEKQDEVIQKQTEVIQQVNTNTQGIAENKKAIEENAKAIEENAKAIESLQKDVELLFKPPATSKAVNNNFDIPANSETLILEFENDADSKFNLTISASIQLVAQVNDLAIALKVNDIVKYTALSTFTFPSFDIEANSGKVELYLVNSSQVAISDINAIANINVRGI